eukprot:4440329-Lingulodinium_polyedra.AAC.1
MKALDDARSALRKDPAESQDDFRVTVFGGPALQATKGIPYDAVAGVARSPAVGQWCKRRG